MTAYRFVTLTCDSCGEIFDNGLAMTFPEARKSARNYGWSHKGSRDYCPRRSCVAAAAAENVAPAPHVHDAMCVLECPAKQAARDGVTP